MKRPDGVTIISIYHFLMAIPLLLGACALSVFALAPVLVYVGERASLFWSLFGIGIGLFFTGFGGLAFLVVGWGLLQLRGWARWGAIVLAILVLPGFPIWTVIGGAIIWYLLQDEAKTAFGAA